MGRKYIAWILLLSMILTLCSGCGSGETTPPSTPMPSANTVQSAPNDPDTEPEKQIGGTYGIAWQSTVELHPYTSTSVTNQAILSLLYESLFLVTGTYQTEAMLCERCAVSENGTVWHFTIREDVSFSDGSAMTAEDVRASLRAAMRSSVYGTRFAYVRSVETDGTYGLIMKLSTPMENLPQLLDIPIVSANSVADQTPIGSGPYYRDGTMLVRNPYYDRTEFSAVTAEQFELIEANNSMEVRNAFEFGGADIAYTDPVSSNASDYHCDYELWSCPTTVMQYIGFNTGSAYFSNQTLRSGVTYAVNRASMIAEVYGGFGQAATLTCSPLSSCYDGALAELYGYNLGGFQSNQVASGLCATKRDPARFIVSASSAKRVEAAEQIAASMGEVGFVVEVCVLEEADFQEALKNGYFDLYLAEIRLPTNFDLSCFFAANGSASYGGAFHAEAQTLMLAALADHTGYESLLRTVVQQGLICPILFKTDGLYATRGVLNTLSPSVSNLYVSGSGVSWTDILEETPYAVDGDDTPADGSLPDGADTAEDTDPGTEPDQPGDGTEA